MIQINLLPGAARGKKASSAKASVDYAAMLAGITAKLGGSPYIPVGIVVAVLGLGATGYLFLKQGKDQTTADDRIEAAHADSMRFAGVLATRAKLEAKRDTLLRQVNLIRTIDEDRFIWPHILDEVSRTLPAYTWITNLSFAGAAAGAANNVALPPKPTAKDTLPNGKKKPMPTEIPKDVVAFRIVGRTVDVGAMTRYFSDLGSSPFVTNMVIERSDPATGEGGKEIYQFTIAGTYRRPDSLSTVVHRTPFTVTVR